MRRDQGHRKLVLHPAGGDGPPHRVPIVGPAFHVVTPDGIAIGIRKLEVVHVPTQPVHCFVGGVAQPQADVSAIRAEIVGGSNPAARVASEAAPGADAWGSGMDKLCGA